MKPIGIIKPLGAHGSLVQVRSSRQTALNCCPPRGRFGGSQLSCRSPQACLKCCEPDLSTPKPAAWSDVGPKQNIRSFSQDELSASAAPKKQEFS
jgi:hypothetical protein